VKVGIRKSKEVKDSSFVEKCSDLFKILKIIDFRTPMIKI